MGLTALVGLLLASPVQCMPRRADLVPPAGEVFARLGEPDTPVGCSVSSRRGASSRVSRRSTRCRLRPGPFPTRKAAGRRGAGPGRGGTIGGGCAAPAHG